MFENLLEWLTSTDGGALIMVLWAVSWGFEEFPQWKDLHHKAKALIILGISIALAVFAVILKSNQGLIEAIEPFATPIYYIVLAWLSTQAAYKVTKFVKPRPREDEDMPLERGDPKQRSD